MKKFFLLFLLGAGSVLYGTPALEHTLLSGQKTVVLRNKYLKASVVPGTMGTIAKLYWFPGQSEVFNDYKYTCTSINELLPEQKSVTFWGNRTLIWNGTVLFYQPLAKFETKTENNAVQLKMSGRFIGGMPVEMTRIITLEKDSAVIKISVTISNFSKQNQEIRLWEHLVPSPEGSIPDVSLIAGAGVRRLGRYQDTEKHTPGLLTDTFKDGNLNRFIVPGSNWIAATGGKTPLSIFLRTNEKNLAGDGFFYTQKDAVAKLHTVEILLNRITLAPGESRTVQLEMGILCGLKTLRRLTENYGFDFKCRGNTLEWHAAALRPLPAKKILLKAGTRKIEIAVPALVPGKSVSGKITDIPADVCNTLEFMEK